ncbi:Sphingoid long-chain bases kinase 1 [Acorus calamus]|uniref:Sphingoid long-chain bases kinase 1 n=1 Tax=Acorus calamus TaxID=4465 RepID=A0AAV9D8B8_ACOCL|nr:Sphingoid long-chain bases kinase 1 [Acorus calamus]
MQKSGISQNNSPGVLPQQSIHQSGSRRSQISTGQHSSPTVFPEKRGKVRSSRQKEKNIANDDTEKVKAEVHKIDIGDEQCDLLGYEVFSGKLVLEKKTTHSNTDVQNATGTAYQDAVDAKLTSKALIWGHMMLSLEDVVSVSYMAGLRQFTVHSYPITKKSCMLSCFAKPQRTRKDFRFLASSPEDAVQWVSGFADQQCFVNFSENPMVSMKKQSSEILAADFLFEPHIKCKSPPKMLVILNPRSGHGRSSKVFEHKVKPIFQGSRQKSSKQQLLVMRENLPPVLISIHALMVFECVPYVTSGTIAFVTALVTATCWVVGLIGVDVPSSITVRDPVSAALAIVKGGLTATDVFAVEWIQTVLELSEKYQKCFGPLRYFVAGFLKFLCLPKYNYELEYLPVSKEVSDSEGKISSDHERIDVHDLYADILQRSRAEGITKASSLSSIDSIITPSRVSEDLDMGGSTLASSEPSDYVRGIDPKIKRLSSGKINVVAEPEEVLHPQVSLSATPIWPRTRSKSRTDKAWTGLTTANDSRPSWGTAAMNDKEDISSTTSDPGPYWDREPKWDTQPKWDAEPNWDGGTEDPIELSGPPDDIELGIKKEEVPKLEEKWVVKKGKFLGVLICNHSCRTVQSFSSQVVAPKAEHDDSSLDLLMVHGGGRLRLLRFLTNLQGGRHVSLPYVEYLKVALFKEFKLKSSQLMIDVFICDAGEVSEG